MFVENNKNHVHHAHTIHVNVGKKPPNLSTMTMAIVQDGEMYALNRAPKKIAKTNKETILNG